MILDLILLCIARIAGEEEVPCHEHSSNYETVGTRLGKGCPDLFAQFLKLYQNDNLLNTKYHLAQVPQGKKESLLSKFEAEKVK